MLSSVGHGDRDSPARWAVTPQHRCLIWGTPAGLTSFQGRRFSTVVEESERAGGSYSIERIVVDRMIPQLDDPAKARLTTYLVKSRQRGNEVPHVGQREVEEALAAAPTSVHERAMSLLEYVALRTENVGDYVVPGDVMPGALAWSESTDAEEVAFLVRYLGSRKLVLPRGKWGIEQQCVVSVEGYSLLETERTASMPYQAFVAMWFDQSMENVYEDGLRPAIEDAGYDACRVDQTQNIGKIDDQIIREIRRSRFVVADFTQGESGNRGSVYYEAGFARGHGVPVISTCREDQIKNLAFDTRQYAHIPWTNPEDLRVDLAARIGALFGEGRRPGF